MLSSVSLLFKELLIYGSIPNLRQEWDLRKSTLAACGTALMNHFQNKWSLAWKLINKIDCQRADVQFSSGYGNESLVDLAPCHVREPTGISTLSFAGNGWKWVKIWNPGRGFNHGIMRSLSLYQVSNWERRRLVYLFWDEWMGKLTLASL